ncbi:hypothetical protein RRG08_022761 [Elysia crispata]|uniref:Uncharacterized protein n=1 Tax=Elysia crispata TaxID=231223 RepID=A0AAE0ZXX4_9GAST|nr:hypothetical protein RRG08_022761 [Elysia crispata]
MMANYETKGHGFLPINFHQAERGRLHLLEVPFYPLRKPREGLRGKNVTGPKISVNPDSLDLIKIAQRNCEGISKKNEALKILLQKENIDITCLQENHLTPNLRFLVRGYQCFRQHRPV